ncbi:MAG TPA: TetR/AcrR family transcriptional regulator [Solirubrobacterales bacterium]|nr:TetR/AcrR family transcriptional regulator [Solirubrobacterales bacterium]
MTDSPKDLRQWQLPRGRHGLPRELVSRSQRERLLAAVVRVTGTRGYEATSVADILEEAGVGRESFYELFEDKQDCILAAHAILVDDLEVTVMAPYRQPGPWVERVRNAVAAMLDWFARDPAAAKVTVVELAALGPTAMERFEAVFSRFTALLDSGIADTEPRPDLPQASSLAIGAALARVYEEIVRGRTTELPGLLPGLTYELLVPFLGEEAARAEEGRAAEIVAAR